MKLGIVASTLVLALLAAVGLRWAQVQGNEVRGYAQAGEALFGHRDARRELPPDWWLRGRLVGQSFMLPDGVLRCANCHQTANKPAAVANELGISDRFGPPLNATALLSTKPRRGGPPSRFDADSFCHVLRTGLDPKLVMISQSMPRYDLTDPQCRALWLYLLSKP